MNSSNLPNKRSRKQGHAVSSIHLQTSHESNCHHISSQAKPKPKAQGFMYGNDFKLPKIQKGSIRKNKSNFTFVSFPKTYSNSLSEFSTSSNKNDNNDDSSTAEDSKININKQPKKINKIKILEELECSCILIQKHFRRFIIFNKVQCLLKEKAVNKKRNYSLSSKNSVGLNVSEVSIKSEELDDSLSDNDFTL